jgi:hypothetical protein
MHGGDFFRLVFEDVSRPERAVDARTEIFEFRGQAAIEDVNAAKDLVMRCGDRRHEMMVAPGVTNSKYLA